MCLNKSFSGEKTTALEEMGSSRLTTNSSSSMITGTKTSNKGLTLEVSYFQFNFINFFYNLFHEEYFTYILNDLQILNQKHLTETKRQLDLP